MVASVVGGSTCSSCLLVCLRLKVPPQVSVSDEFSLSGSESEEATRPGTRAVTVGGDRRSGAPLWRGLDLWCMGGTGGLRNLGGVDLKYPGIRSGKGSLIGGGEGVRNGGGELSPA